MSLASTIQKATVSAFKAIKSIPLICTYTSVGTPIYNPTTGEYTGGDAPYAGLSFLFENYTAMEINQAGGTIISTDSKASIPNVNLVPSPKATDYIVDSANVKWTVENVLIDSARALWILQARKGS